MSIYSHSFLLLLCTCTTFIQPVPYWWILELFLTFAITTNAAKNILVHTSFCTFASVSLGESFRSVTAGSRVNSLATATTGTVPPALYPHQWYVRMYSEASDLKAYQGWEPWHLKISYENYEEKSSRWLVPRGSVQFTDCAVYSQKPCTRKYQWKVFDNVKCSYFFLKWSSNDLLIEMSRRCHIQLWHQKKPSYHHPFQRTCLTVNIQVCEMDQKLIIRWAMWGS